MPLNAAAAAVVATAIVAHLAIPPGPAAAIALASWTLIVEDIFVGIQSNAQVVGVATGAMAGGPGVPVAGGVT